MRAYIRAYYRYGLETRTDLVDERNASAKIIRVVADDCPASLVDAPGGSEEHGAFGLEVTGAVLVALAAPEAASERRFIQAAGRLRWQSVSLRRAVDAYMTELRRQLALQAPDLCGDAMAWRSTGFTKLPLSTERFVRALKRSVSGPGEVPSRLLRTEAGAEGLRQLQHVARLEHMFDSAKSALTRSTILAIAKAIETPSE